MPADTQLGHDDEENGSEDDSKFLTWILRIRKKKKMKKFLSSVEN